VNSATNATTTFTRHSAIAAASLPVVERPERGPLATSVSGGTGGALAAPSPNPNPNPKPRPRRSAPRHSSRLPPRRRRNPASLRCAVYSRHPPPLSPQRSASAHRTHDGGSARAGVGLQHVSPRWSTALGRGTYGDCVVGQDVQGLLRTLHRQVRRMLAGRAASPNPDGRFDTLHNRYTASTEQRRDTLECNRCSWCARVSVQ
jgi:hypothetical protein